jgi:molybdopterin molybdotransferase
MRAFGTPSETLLAVDDAVEKVLARILPLEAETVPLGQAHRRVLAEDVTASTDVPPADNSAMDGYAVRASDTPGSLRVIGDLPAGRQPSRAVEAGTAIRIMTGAAIPPGADAVAQVEITDGGATSVAVREAVRAGANVRRRGDDMRKGAVVLSSGTWLGAGEVGVAAAARRVSLRVTRRPLVSILATGDELAGIGESEDSRIVDSNSYALAALVSETGAIARRAPLVRDDLAATTAAIENALDADVVITTGGVSVGAYDFVKEALESLGAETHFWRVAMKPGKPVLFATVRGRAFFGLPGNPVSALVSFAVFVAPAIRKALGRSSALTSPIVRMKTVARLKGAGDRRAYLRVRVVSRDGVLSAEPMSAQGSHVSTSMVQANGLAIVDGSAVEAGEVVPVMMIGPVSAV